jgi:hypothetical protein
VRLACLLARSLPLSASCVTVKKRTFKKTTTICRCCLVNAGQSTVAAYHEVLGQGRKNLPHEPCQHRQRQHLQQLPREHRDVRREHFPHREPKNFCNNFRNFAAAWALESEYTGARLGEEAGGKLACLYLSYHSTLANIPPSHPLAKPQTAKGASSPTTTPMPTKSPTHTKPHPKK